MNLPHVHLLLNHFPIIGTIIALALFLFALIGKSDDLKRASLVIFAGIALLSIPTYMSGNGAEEAAPETAGGVEKRHRGTQQCGAGVTGVYGTHGHVRLARPVAVPPVSAHARLDDRHCPSACGGHRVLHVRYREHGRPDPSLGDPVGRGVDLPRRALPFPCWLRDSVCLLPAPSGCGPLARPFIS